MSWSDLLIYYQQLEWTDLLKFFLLLVCADCILSAACTILFFAIVVVHKAFTCAFRWFAQLFAGAK
jgi:hypothetical protein